MKFRTIVAIAFILSLALIWFFLALPSRHVYARDMDGKYASSPNHEWFASQKNNNNVSCCEIADGHHLDDADWKADDKGNYWIRINGDWREVPDYAVINPKNRPVDYAVVWIYQDQIYCFMAGAGM